MPLATRLPSPPAPLSLPLVRLLPGLCVSGSSAPTRRSARTRTSRSTLSPTRSWSLQLRSNSCTRTIRLCGNEDDVYIPQRSLAGREVLGRHDSERFGSIYFPTATNNETFSRTCSFLVARFSLSTCRLQNSKHQMVSTILLSIYLNGMLTGEYTGSAGMSEMFTVYC
jgi:hypothetical protein